MNQRPKIKFEKSKADQTITKAAFAFSIFSLLLGIYFYNSLPDQIPSHFNAKGQVDDYSGKSLIFILPIISLIMIILLNYLSKIPHSYNYPIKITEDNAAKQYDLASKMISRLALSISFIFLIITIEILYTALYQASLLAGFSIIIVILIIFIPIFLYFRDVRK